MIIHAVSEEQKKMQAQHIVSGCICKNCIYGNDRKVCSVTKDFVTEYGYCERFERKPTT